MNHSEEVLAEIERRLEAERRALLAMPLEQVAQEYAELFDQPASFKYGKNGLVIMIIAERRRLATGD